ncbi:PE domain-containing protein [Mycobacterium tuberculosis]|uniref:PE domain-containing protein n=1 Tax=Mycobacterium tuberculosis TaxID=1773 RepID=UPI00160114C4|nr:PE domain-containing protein [Mycobacterium tuberculosis]
MSFVIATPEMLTTAATDLAKIGSTITAANTAAAAVAKVLPASADEVSVAVAALFGTHAQEYQTVSAQVATFHDRFVQTLSAAASSYVAAEAVNVEQSLLAAVNAPTQALFGRPLIGNGADGSPGTGQAGGPGGILYGNGGNGGSGAPGQRGGAGGAAGLIGNGGMATIGGGGNGQSIVIDFVRHGQTPGNAAMLIDTAVPGPGLTALGQQQAQAIANALAAKGPYAGIFDSQLIRTQQTAAPLANLLGMAPQVLPGLNEIHAGIFEDLPQISPAGLLYLVGPIAWTLGFPIVPMLAPGSTDVNGIVFNRAFTGAVQTIYDASLANPVVAADGNITSVAYSSAFTIGVGTMMNVDNPHPLLLLTHPVPNTGAVVVQGNPEGGWTLVSWDGIPVGPASLPTALFVDVRELITAPQYAAYDIWESLFTGDPAAVINAVRDGADEVGAAVVQFPHAVADDVIDATGHPYLSGLPIGLPSLIP